MENVYKALEELGIEYVKHEHPPVFTTEEADEHWKDVNAAHVKNLFLRNAKGNEHYLVVVHCDKKVDLKALREKLGTSRLSFGSPERLMKHFGVTAGSVSLLGILNDANQDVVVVIDKELWDREERFGFHPNINTATLEIKKEDVEKFVNWRGNEMRIVEL